jgi:hypothetical protein
MADLGPFLKTKRNICKHDNSTTLPQPLVWILCTESHAPPTAPHRAACACEAEREPMLNISSASAYERHCGALISTHMCVFALHSRSTPHRVDFLGLKIASRHGNEWSKPYFAHTLTQRPQRSTFRHKCAFSLLRFHRVTPKNIVLVMPSTLEGTGRMQRIFYFSV